MTKTDRFEIKLLETVKKFDMFHKGDRVLVGFSGGKDSVALLYALNKLSSHIGISIVAFHLNHGIRGEEADEDMKFSQSFCEKFSIPFSSSFVSVPSLCSDDSKGIESVARDVRYSEFARVAGEYGCNKIATAHTASDNSETVIITLTRNSNIKGIPPVRENIVRPILFHTTKEVLNYCERNNLNFVTDSTNADDNYTRNFIRSKILPEIYSHFPSFDESTKRFSAIQRSNNALTEIVANRYLEENKSPMDLRSLMPLATDVAYYNVLYLVISKHFNVNISYSQFDDIIDLIESGKTGNIVNLSNGVSFKRGYECLEFLKGNTEYTDFQLSLKIGKNIIPHSNLVLWIETPEQYSERINKNVENNTKVNKLTKNILIKYNIIALSLVARSRQHGDSFVCRGIKRSVKKFMIDEKIPAELRSRIPIVCDENGIVWVPGLGLADRCNTENTKGETYSFSLEF